MTKSNKLGTGRMRVRGEGETLATSEGEGMSDYEVNKRMNGVSLVLCKKTVESCTLKTFMDVQRRANPFSPFMTPS
jgi:hypothetical protein